jgi:hypothetical protein
MWALLWGSETASLERLQAATTEADVSMLGGKPNLKYWFASLRALITLDAAVSLWWPLSRAFLVMSEANIASCTSDGRFVKPVVWSSELRNSCHARKRVRARRASATLVPSSWANIASTASVRAAGSLIPALFMSWE